MINLNVAILFKKWLKYKVLDTREDTEGRILILDITINDIRLTLANIYAPNNDTPTFIEEVNGKINEFDNNSKIVGGDSTLF